MPVSFTDVVAKVVNGVLTATPGTWIQLRNNVTTILYTASGAVDINGVVPFTNVNVPAGSYTVRSGPAQSGAFVDTTETGYIVPVVKGVVTKTANYTAIDGDTVLANAVGGAFNVTLPALAVGLAVIVKKTDASANGVTVLPGAGTIDGAANFVLLGQYHSATFVSDGTNWFVTETRIMDGQGRVAAGSFTASIGPYAPHAGLAAGFQAMPYGSSSGVSVGPTMVNLQARGADMSGAVDVGTVWTAALAELPNNSGVIYAPPGTLKATLLDTPLQSTGYLTIQGAGRKATTFQGYGAQDHTIKLQMPGEICDCTVDGGGSMTGGAVLYLVTSGANAIKTMAARRVEVGNPGVNGFWTLAVWDSAQIFQIDTVWLDDVRLYGPNKNSLDGAVLPSFVKHCFIKNMVIDGVARPNFYCCDELDIDGLRVINSIAGAASMIIDVGVAHARVSHTFVDNSVNTWNLQCADASFDDCRFENTIQGPFNATQPLVKWKFHNVEALRGMNIEGAVELLEIAGGEWGGVANAVLTDFSPGGTVHKVIRISDAALGGVNIFNAFNATVTITELTVANCTGRLPGRTLVDATLVNLSPTLTSARGVFTANDVGRTVVDNIGGQSLIPGATTISAFVDASHVTMSANATGTTAAGSPDIVVLGGLDITFTQPPWNGNTAVTAARSRLFKNQGLNPVGTETPAVPASGTPVAAVQWDRTYYVSTVAGTTTCSMAIQNGPTVTFVGAVAQVIAVKVPAGKTVTPAYTGTAPTWVVEGE